ncbi:hypothetical protein BDZ89DRAFT_1147184 [Hymenopellis radicata]|nr:hypothetical protein BDZ89DRAFT_1147184 [Hymenopellis radicata]
MITRRLDTDERSLISAGNVYVWEERGASAESTGTGIERWTDGIRWGPSRVRDGFLFYQEKQDENHLYNGNALRTSHSSRNDAAKSVLTKQTYTVNVPISRWNAKVAPQYGVSPIAYFTDAALNSLRTVDQIPQLANLTVPHEHYQTARAVKGRPEHIFNAGSSSSGSASYSRLEYVQYHPRSASPSPTSPDSPSPSSSRPSYHFHRMASSPPPPRRHSHSRPYTPAPYPPAPHGPPEKLAPLTFLSSLAPTPRAPEDQQMIRKLPTHH